MATSIPSLTEGTLKVPTSFWRRLVGRVGCTIRGHQMRTCSETFSDTALATRIRLPPGTVTMWSAGGWCRVFWNKCEKCGAVRPASLKDAEHMVASEDANAGPDVEDGPEFEGYENRCRGSSSEEINHG